MDNALYKQFEGLDELLAYYAEIDTLTTEFTQETGINCLPSCSRCCDAPSVNIEATVFELIPLALHLWQTGEAERYHELAQQAGDEGRCVIYKPDEVAATGGGCSKYQYRGLICRVFGASAVRDKHGKRQLSLCMLIPPIEGQAPIDKAAVIAECAAHARSFNPSLSSERHSINEAIRLAIEKVMLTAQLMGISPPKSD